MGIQSVEQGIERMVDGMFKRSKNSVRPIEIGRRLLREMDDQRSVDVEGNRIVPNEFAVVLSEPDRAGFADIESILRTELIEAVREYAREENYQFLGPVNVSISADPDLRPGRFAVTSEIASAAAAAARPRTGVVVMPSGQQIELTDGDNLIGRLADCAVVIADTNTSRHHAKITRIGSGFAVSDLGSTNGTFVNGSRVDSNQPVVDGDTITVGTVTLRFEEH